MGVPGAAPWARGRPPPIVLVVCLHVALMFYLVCAFDVSLHKDVYLSMVRVEIHIST